MPAVLAQATIVALPTTYGEGVPKILVEAAAAGRPIVATDTRGCREIVHNGVNGLLVRPGDRAGLARAIADILASKELRARMGSAGREIAMAEFSEETVVSQTLNVYRHLLGPGAL
jgi:glycosyltransferase involved in cell wall biosynthesis